MARPAPLVLTRLGAPLGWASLLGASLFGASLLWAPCPALAQDAGTPTCDAPLVRRPESTYPVHGAREVTLDAPLRVRYTRGYFESGGPGGDPADLLSVAQCNGTCGDPTACEDEPTVVSGLGQVLGDELVFFPDGGWDPQRVYTGTAQGRDENRTFQFCTGSALDDAPPMLGALSEVTSTVAPVSCDAPEGGYRIGVFFEPAIDLGPPGSVEYLLYQTRGEGIDGPVVRNRLSNFAADLITMAFVLPPDEANGAICVRVAAVDGVGNVTFNESDEGGDCVDPVQGNFFQGLCSAGPQARRAGSLGLLGPSFALALLALRRRR